MITLCALHYNERRLYESSGVRHRHGTYTPQDLILSVTQAMAAIFSLPYAASLQNPSVDLSTDGDVSNNNPKQGPTISNKGIDKPELSLCKRIAMVFSLIGLVSIFEHQIAINQRMESRIMHGETRGSPIIQHILQHTTYLCRAYSILQHSDLFDL